MGYNLKLDIYVFDLKIITEVMQRRRQGEIITGYKTAKDISIFKEVFKAIYHDKEDEDYFKFFFTDFTNSFGNKFKTNITETQAVCVTDKLRQGLSLSNHTLWGEFLGGETGIDQEIFNMDNAQQAKDKIGKNQVTSLRFFYKLWIPFDNTKGILMIQGYTDKSYSTLFKTFIESLFIEKGYKINWYKFIPQNYIKSYLGNSSLYQLKIVSTCLNKDIDPLRPLFDVFKKAKTIRYIRNFSLPLYKLFETIEYQSLLKKEISAIDLNFDESCDELVLYYKDKYGNKAHSSLYSIDSVLPTIQLDNDLKDPETQLVKWNEINIFTNELLNKIMIEIGYKPKEI